MGKVRKICLNCQAEFNVKPCEMETAKFCSVKCCNAFKRIEKTCLQCGKNYTTKKHRQDTSKYCSKSCQSIYRSVHFVGKNAPGYKNGNSLEKDMTLCRVCGKDFLQKRIYLFNGFGNICSKECRAVITSRWQLENKPNVVERVEVICEWCGISKELIPSFVKTFRFCSKLCRNEWQSKVRMKGENHPLWNGGASEIRSRLSVSREYKAFRKSVFDRDKYTCQMCGDARGGNLEAHHIKPLATHPELAFIVENGLTVCKDCHTRIHKEMPSLVGKGRLKEFFG